MGWIRATVVYRHALSYYHCTIITWKKPVACMTSCTGSMTMHDGSMVVAQWSLDGPKMVTQSLLYFTRRIDLSGISSSFHHLHSIMPGSRKKWQEPEIKEEDEVQQRQQEEQHESEAVQEQAVENDPHQIWMLRMWECGWVPSRLITRSWLKFLQNFPVLGIMLMQISRTGPWKTNFLLRLARYCESLVSKTEIWNARLSSIVILMSSSFISSWRN